MDEFAQARIVRLVIRLHYNYKNGHKTHYASRRTMLCSLSSLFN